MSGHKRLDGRFLLVGREGHDTVVIGCFDNLEAISLKDSEKEYMAAFYSKSGLPSERHIVKTEILSEYPCKRGISSKNFNSFIRITSYFKAGTHYDPIQQKYRYFNGSEPTAQMSQAQNEPASHMQELKVTCTCIAKYTSNIQVPSGLSFEEALDYAQEHINAIPVSRPLEYVGSSQIDRENCRFIN